MNARAGGFMCVRGFNRMHGGPHAVMARYTFFPVIILKAQILCSSGKLTFDLVVNILRNIKNKF